MGKITIKHYANTELKPIIENGKLKFPLYVQVIYNRNVYKFKSSNDTFQYIHENDLTNDIILSLLNNEKLDIERTIKLLFEYDKKLINAKNIATFSKPFDVIIEENFCKLIAKEVPNAPNFFKTSSFREISEVLFFLNSYELEQQSEKISKVKMLIGNLGYPSFEYFEKNYIAIDFYTGSKFEEIENIINYTFGGYEKDVNLTIETLREFINL